MSVTAEQAAGGRHTDDLELLMWGISLLAGAVLVGAILLLGEPLGNLLLRGHSLRILPVYAPLVQPKPAEEARYILAVLAAVGVALIVALAPDRLLTLLGGLGRTRAVLIVVAQLTMLGVLIWGLAGQFSGLNGAFPADHFRPANLLPAALVAIALVVGTAVGWLHWGPTEERRWARCTPRLIAVVLAALWLSPGLYRALNLAHAPFAVSSTTSPRLFALALSFVGSARRSCR